MKTPEELLIRIMNGLAERLRDRLILKGGMLLRLLKSPRATRDVDYVLVSNESKKILVVPIKEALQGLEEVTLGKVSLNSRGIIIEVLDQKIGQTALIEITVVPKTNLPPEPLSTATLAEQYSMGGRVISTMALPEALSHKIAAALERDLVRDLYDLMILGRLTSFDEQTLRERLSKLEIRRARPRSVTPLEAAGILQQRVNALTPERVETELSSALQGEPLQGLEIILKAAVSRVIAQIERLK